LRAGRLSEISLGLAHGWISDKFRFKFTHRVSGSRHVLLNFSRARAAIGAAAAAHPRRLQYLLNFDQLVYSSFFILYI